MHAFPMGPRVVLAVGISRHRCLREPALHRVVRSPRAPAEATIEPPAVSPLFAPFEPRESLHERAARFETPS
jgi:hypothetical protein